MRRSMILTAALMLFMLLSRCSEEPERLEDYLVDIATRVKADEGCRYRLDNNRLLIPREGEECSGSDRQRVILNYSFLKGDTIRVNAVGEIFTDSIRSVGYPEKLGTDPVKIQSLWLGGGYLNLIVETEYHSQPHKVALFRDNTTGTTDLWFSHSRDEDPPGYRKKMYASFSLEALQGTNNGDPISFRLFIQTDSGIRTFHFTLPG
ncbi:hypothetical protein JS578_01945 [Dysgonomonadaceae bacterium zrk40]|nr:hypothetical protein JS578_01945 [Dysgonomonadaceae bacterium zrk40]